MPAKLNPLMVGPDRGESANWILPDLAPMKDRNREIRCLAARRLTQERKPSASAIAMRTKGGFVRPFCRR